MYVYRSDDVIASIVVVTSTPRSCGKTKEKLNSADSTDQAEHGPRIFTDLHARTRRRRLPKTDDGRARIDTDFGESADDDDGDVGLVSRVS